MKSCAPTAWAAAATSAGLASGRAEGDVVAHRAGEEEAFLRHDPELPAERLLGHVAEVDAVDRDPPLERVVEAGEQLRDRRLAGACVPDERDGRPGRDVEVDPVQHLGARAVAEPDVLPADMAVDPVEVPCVRLVADLGLLVHHVHDVVERGDRGQERVVELRELLDGVEEVRDVEDEREQRADHEAPAEDEVAAVAEHDRGRERREEVDEREVEAVQDDRLLVRLAVVGVDGPEVPLVRPLAAERLDDAHAADVLGERGRDESEPLPYGAVGAGRADAEDRRRDEHERQHGSVASASRQSRKKRMIAVPNRKSVLWTSVVTPSVTSWSSASTSFVSRLMITPARLRS